MQPQELPTNSFLALRFGEADEDPPTQLQADLAKPLASDVPSVGEVSDVDAGAPSRSKKPTHKSEKPMVTWEAVAGASGGYCQDGLSSQTWKSGGSVKDQHACQAKCIALGISCDGIAFDYKSRKCMTCLKAVPAPGTAGGGWGTYAKRGGTVPTGAPTMRPPTVNPASTPTNTPTNAPTCKGRALTAQYGWGRCATCAKDMSLFNNGYEHFACTSCHPGSILYISNTCYNTGPCRAAPKCWDSDGNSRGPRHQSNKLVHSVCEPNMLDASATQLICTKYAKSIPFKHGFYQWNHQGHTVWGVAQCHGHKVLDTMRLYFLICRCSV